MAAPFEVSVKSNVRELTRGLDDLQRRRIPGVTAGALDDTAFGVKKREVEVIWPRSVNVRNRRFLGTALRVEQASKLRPRSAVFDRLGRDFLPRQAEGGVKRPRRRGRLAVPTEKPKRLASGRIRKRDLPGSLRANPRAFLLRARSGHQMIAERQGRKRLPIRVLYHLTSHAEVAKAFRFYEEAEDETDRQFPRHFARRLDRVLTRMAAAPTHLR